MEQDVVQRLVPHLGRLDEHLQIALGLLLADVLPEGLGPQGVFSLVLPGEGGGHQRLQVLILIFRSGKVDRQRFTSPSKSVSVTISPVLRSLPVHLLCGKPRRAGTAFQNSPISTNSIQKKPPKNNAPAQMPWSLIFASSS
ncbi:MAG: hypothetical protein ACLT3D_11455 [Lawsonibacter sp.]